LSQGEEAKLMVTADCAFGAAGAGEGIVPPNADVQFDVELIKVEKKVVVGEAAAQPVA
jgi:FKBP-type peptidyl-prolyl cis-trans isomerase